MEYEIYNPNNKPLNELPFIYGFNNGGSVGWMFGQLISQDGFGMGSHICSSEEFMYSDLGCTKGSRPDRHEGFKKHYPDGYQMMFVPSIEIENHSGIQSAFKLAAEQQKNSVQAKNANIKIDYS